MKKIRIEDLANNPPRHPGLQDLDIWTKEQLIDYIKLSTKKFHKLASRFMTHK
jgi:hypothetical protein